MIGVWGCRVLDTRGLGFVVLWIEVSGFGCGVSWWRFRVWRFEARGFGSGVSLLEVSGSVFRGSGFRGRCFAAQDFGFVVSDVRGLRLGMRGLGFGVFEVRGSGSMFRDSGFGERGSGFSMFGVSG